MTKPVIIDGRDFETAMTKHWINNLNNVPNDSLRKLWRTMGDTYAEAIQNTFNQDSNDKEFTSTWSVLQLPTGTGKSQGAALYAAMLAVESFRSKNPSCVLIVVRQKKQCKELCDAVRKAIVEISDDLELGTLCDYHHSDHQLSSTERKSKYVLICTHAAYVGSVSSVELTPDRFGSFTHYSPNDFEIPFRRCLTIIDESLGAVVETSQITLENIDRLFLCIGVGSSLRETYRKEIQTLEDVRDILNMAKEDHRKTPDTVYRDLQARFRKLPSPEQLDLDGFWKRLKSRDLATLIQGGKSSAQDRARYGKMFNQTIEAVKACLRQWRYYAKEYQKTSINTSSFVIPDNLIAPVCLDATASNNYLWQLLGENKARIVQTPQDARNYDQVTLNVSLQEGKAGLGKGGMIKKATGRSKRLIAHLNKVIDPTEDVLIVCHKKLKPQLIQCLEEDPDATSNDQGRPEWFRLQNGARVYVNHWWALDGLNTFQECSHVVIFGLPYHDDVWALNLIFALQGYQPGLLSDSSSKHRTDYRRRLEYQQMTLMVIQAINRVRCRRVVDGAGRCDATQVWILLPEGRPETKMILEGLRKDMPNIKEQAWAYGIDDPKERLYRPKDSTSAAPFALIEFMENAQLGEISLAAIAKALGFTTSQKNRLRDRLTKEFKERAGTLYQALKDLAVDYVSQQGKAAVLVKHYTG